MSRSPSASDLSLAERVLHEDPKAIEALLHSPLIAAPDNFVRRPWGGASMAAYKQCDPPADQAGPWGEAFELAAHHSDPEARAHPSRLVLADGSTLLLPELLSRAGRSVLGERLFAQQGPNLPLLPKTLDVAELLSVQAHPRGFTEVYVILDAEPGATLRLGFAAEVDGDALRSELAEGRRWQEELLTLLGGEVDQQALQRALAAIFRRREGADAAQLASIAQLGAGAVDLAALAARVAALQQRYWQVLDRLNAVAAVNGQVIYNATPERLRLADAQPAAEVHALGNPEGRAILALEIRRPTVTYRAWDHVRFPLREIDVERTLEALSLAPTRPDEFIVEPLPVPGRPGVFRSVRDPSFALEHLRPTTAQAVSGDTCGAAQTLHVLRGAVCLSTEGAAEVVLPRGHSALLPATLGAYTLRQRGDEPPEALVVTFPQAATRPAFLHADPVELSFGTSGLRGLVREMTDLEVAINARGFIDYLIAEGELSPGDPVAIAEDLRAVDPVSGLSSSPRIAGAVAHAIREAGCRVVHCGQIPTPALAAWSLCDDPAAGKAPSPSVMITGSHIPADRNGVKFYRRSGEVLKSDEAGILAAVARVRAVEYGKSAEETAFDTRGMLKASVERPPVDARAEVAFLARFTQLFSDAPLAGKRIVLYQHSAVGRDLLARLLGELGAEVVAVERSETFVPVDTEDVHEADLALFARLAKEHGPCFAIVSTDGDSDRPLVIDETGRFHRGDVLGIVVAELVGATFAAVPISASDALDLHLAARAQAGLPVFQVERTRIGSPYVIAAMEAAVARGERVVCGWESNGGFLTATDLPLGQGVLPALPTRDAFLPIVAALLAAVRRGCRVSELFAELPPRYTGAGLIDAFPTETSRAIIAALSPDAAIEQVHFDRAGVRVTLRERDGRQRSVFADGPLTQALLDRQALLARYFNAARGFGRVTRINFLDGVRCWFEAREGGSEIAHLRPSGNAPQLRIYAVSDSEARTAAIVQLALDEPGGILRQLEAAFAVAAAPSTTPSASSSEVSAAQAARLANLDELRRIVDASEGPRQVLAIANGGDGPIVGAGLTSLARDIFRADGATRVLVHEEKTRRGQLLGLLDALRSAHAEGLVAEGVALGIMLPGKGTRLSPLTQRLHGIKPFLPMLIRQASDRGWLSGAAASLYSWTHLAHHLERLGFAGIAWKWGDEPQIAARRLAELDLDLSRTDAVRFGSAVRITEDLARNKEWLFAGDDGRLRLQVRRRSRAELLQRFGYAADAVEATALVHLGSPALSWAFIEEASAVFADTPGWLDVDGYLFEALTHEPDAWQAEVARDAGLRELLGGYPRFYAQVCELKRRLEDRRGHALDLRVIDYGEGLYWGDIGQLAKARQAFSAVALAGETGDFARRLAAIDGVSPDAWGNRLVGSSKAPTDGSVRNSVLIDTRIVGAARLEGAVLVQCELGTVSAAEGSVAYGCTAGSLQLAARAFAFQSLGKELALATDEVHTSVPVDPADLSQGLQDYRFDANADPGKGEAYAVAFATNPASFADLFARMRQRAIRPEAVEQAIDEQHRGPLRTELGL